MLYLTITIISIIALLSIILSMRTILYKTDYEYEIIDNELYNKIFVSRLIQDYNERTIHDLLICVEVLKFDIEKMNYSLTIYNEGFISIQVKNLYSFILLDVKNGFYHLYSKDKIVKSGLLSLSSMNLSNQILIKKQ